MHDSDIKTTSTSAATADHVASPRWNDAVSQPKPFFSFSCVLQRKM